MSITNLDPHEHIALSKRVSEIERQLKARDNCHESRTEKIGHWERLLDELADLQDKVRSE
jgi:hypothetical protein